MLVIPTSYGREQALYEVKMAGCAIYNANDATTTRDARWQKWQTTTFDTTWTVEIRTLPEESVPIPSIYGHRYWQKGVFVPNENKPMSKGLRIIIIQKPLKQNIGIRKVSRPRAPPDK
jgi:hypothetical protein